MSNETGLKQAILSFGKCKVLLVELQNDQKWFIGNDTLAYFIRITDRHGRDIERLPRPYPNSRPKFLGKLSELTEKQFAGIVEIMDTILNEDDTDSYFYRDYRTEEPDLGQFSARESFLSKMQAEGYYTVNPHAKTGVTFSGCSTKDKKEFADLMKQRKDTAAARTFPPDQTYVFIILKQQDNADAEV